MVENALREPVTVHLHKFSGRILVSINWFESDPTSVLTISGEILQRWQAATCTAQPAKAQGIAANSGRKEMEEEGKEKADPGIYPYTCGKYLSPRHLQTGAFRTPVRSSESLVHANDNVAFHACCPCKPKITDHGCGT